MEVGQEQIGTAPKADHLCVLVHGLWGNPTHMGYIASSLKKRYDDDHLFVLAAERNTGNLTYDGIDVCGERLAHEIEETLDALKTKGYQIRKFSIVGYSLGGLISRYALGLLFARGWFDKVEPVNFTTFASPHLGARAPVKGTRDHLFNGLGARAVSFSGKQMFMIDTFRDSGKPLLSVLADPNSIFLPALAKFKHRTVYGNIINDRTTAFYTTVFMPLDHFRNPENLRINYVKGYEPVVINHDGRILQAENKAPLPLPTRVKDNTRRFFKSLPFWARFSAIVMIGIPIFFFYSVVETSRSRKRIRMHEEGESATLFNRYRMSIAVRRVQTAMEEVLENAASRQNPDYLSLSIVAPPELESQAGLHHAGGNLGDTSNQTKAQGNDDSVQVDKTCTTPNPRTLTLTAGQFSMIKSLDSVGFRKYPIYIHNDNHSHAAIIVRYQKDTFDEGPVVIKHWLDREFEL